MTINKELVVASTLVSKAEWLLGKSIDLTFHMQLCAFMTGNFTTNMAELYAYKKQI